MDDKQKTILIVDGEKGATNAIRGILHETCRVYRAADTEEALRILKQEPPDLIFSDRNLPGGTTIDLFSETNVGKTDAVPVISSKSADLQIAVRELSRTPSSINLPSSLNAGQIEKILLALLSDRLQQSLEKQRLIEQRLLQHAKMASLGELVAGILHEINNPLAFISNNLQNLLKFSKRLMGFIDAYDRMAISDEVKALIKTSKEELKYDYLRNRMTEMIEQSITGADRMKKIIQEYKFFSRVQDNVIVEADLNVAIDSTLSLLYYEYKNRIEIKKNYGVLPPVKCYISKLNQVFMNLLINAIQAMAGTGTIEITTRTEGENVVIEISDTGGGIPENVVDKIFDPFFTTKPPGVGTGLGLSITREIIELHRGQIAVKSKQGLGATFTLTLPSNLCIEQ